MTDHTRMNIRDDLWKMEDAACRADRVRVREERRRHRRRQNLLAVLIIGSVALGVATVAIAQVRTPAVVVRHVAVVQRPEPASATSTPAPTKATVATPAPARPARPAVAVRPAAPAQSQRFAIAIGTRGYEPSVVKAKAGAPITLVVAKGVGCAAGFLMPSRAIVKDNTKGPVTVSLGKLKAGVYPFSCGMEMVQGRLIVS